MILRQARTAIAILPLLATLATGCEHKDLCYDHPDHATRYQTQINASYSLIWEMPATDGYDWATHWPDAFGIGYHSLNPSMPEGLCVNAYSSDGRKTSRHLPPTGGIVEMTPGINSLLMYNDDTEYIVFDDLNNSVSAKATTRARSRTGYTGNTLNPARGNDTEKTVSPPDALFGYYAETFDQKPSVSPGRIDVTLKPLVFSYLVRYEFTHGVKYIGVARGALTGMAESVYLYDGHTGKTQATILYDCEVHDWGVQAVVNSFGIPDYPNQSYSRAGTFYGLGLEVRLRNGKIIRFDHDISDQIAAQPHGGVVVVSGLEISDEDGKESGSGFEIGVDDWGEFEDIIVDM